MLTVDHTIRDRYVSILRVQCQTPIEPSGPDTTSSRGPSPYRLSPSTSSLRSLSVVVGPFPAFPVSQGPFPTHGSILGSIRP